MSASAAACQRHLRPPPDLPAFLPREDRDRVSGGGVSNRLPNLRSEKKPGYAARFFSPGKNLELKFIDRTDREHIDVTLTGRVFLAHLREHLIFRPAGPLLRERVLSSDAEA